MSSAEVIAPWQSKRLCHSSPRSFRLLAHEGIAGAQVPIYQIRKGAIPLGSPEKRAPEVSAEVQEIDGIPGACSLRGVLRPGDCQELISLAEGIGFASEPATTAERIRLAVQSRTDDSWTDGRQADVRSKHHWDTTRPPRLTCLADVDLNANLLERVRPMLPRRCLGGNLRGLNPRWRIYRYTPGGDAFRPHLDDAYDESVLNESSNESCSMLTTRPTVRSRASLLVYLSDCQIGGETRFWIPSTACEDFNFEHVRPTAGGAVFFYHGEHPLSVVHEALPVRQGTKYVLRTDVLYDRCDVSLEAASEFNDIVEQWPHIYQGRLYWELLQQHHRSAVVGFPLDTKLKITSLDSAASSALSHERSIEWIAVD